MPASSLYFDSKEASWSAIKVVIAGREVTGIRGVKYKISQEKEQLFGAGDEPIGIQRGNRTYEGELKLLKYELDLLTDAAHAAGARDIMDIRLDVIITYQWGSNPLRTDALLGVEFKEAEKGMDQNAKFMEITIPVLFMRLQTNI
ncbi:MAG: hypothetical protein EPN37_04510 [Chitinophagaceae bacterium]|nr:MAG: hypothetical protein EPN37_04510 [Chitinophagaceae bacterium]